MGSIEKVISWFRNREGKVTYSMTNRLGPNSFDCSSSVYYALIEGGFLLKGSMGNTETLYALEGTLLKKITRSEVKRGDIFISGGKGTSLGANGHTGVFVSNSKIIHCNYGTNGIAETVTDYGYMGGPPNDFYRIIGSEDLEYIPNGNELPFKVTRMHGIRTHWYLWNGLEIAELRAYLKLKNWSYSEYKSNGHIGFEVKWFNQNSVNKQELQSYLEKKKWHYEMITENSVPAVPSFHAVAGELPFKVKKMHGIRTYWFVWNGYEIVDLRAFLNKLGLNYSEFKSNGHIGIDVKWFNQDSVNKKVLTDYLERKKWHYEMLIQ